MAPGVGGAPATLQPELAVALASSLAEENARLSGALSVSERFYKLALSESEARSMRLEDESLKLAQEVDHLRGLLVALIEGGADSGIEEQVATTDLSTSTGEEEDLAAKTKRLLVTTVSLCRAAGAHASSGGSFAGVQPSAQAEAQSALAERERELEQLRKEKADLEAEKNYHATAHKGLVGELLRTKEQSKHLEAAETEAQGKLQQSEEALRVTSGEHALLLQESQQLREERDRLAGELATRSRVHEELELLGSQAKAELQARAREISELRSEAEALKGKNGQLEAEWQELSLEVTKVREENFHLLEEKEELLGEQQNSAGALEHFKDEHRRLFQQTETLLGQHRNSAKELMQAKDDNHRLCERSDQLLGELQTSAQEQDRLKEENKGLREQIEALQLTQHELTQLREEVERATAGHKEAVDEQERLQRQLAHVEGERQELEKLEAQARLDVEDHLERLAEASQENAGLSKSNQVLRLDCDRLEAEKRQILAEKDRVAGELQQSERERRRLVEAERHLQAKAQQLQRLSNMLEGQDQDLTIPQDQDQGSEEEDGVVGTPLGSCPAVGHRPSVPSTTSSMPQMIPAMRSGSLSSVPRLSEVRLSEMAVTAGRSEPEAPITPAATDRTVSVPQETVGDALSLSAPALMPPVAVTVPVLPVPPGGPTMLAESPDRVRPAEEDATLAAEVAARFVRSLVEAYKERTAGAAPVPTATFGRESDLSEPQDSARNSEVSVADQAAVVDLIATRPTIQITPAVPAESGLAEARRSRRHSFQDFPTADSQSKSSVPSKFKTFAAGEQNDNELEEAREVVRNLSMPVAGTFSSSEFDHARLSRSRAWQAPAGGLQGSVGVESLTPGGRLSLTSEGGQQHLPAKLQALRELRREREPGERLMVERLFVVETNQQGQPSVRYRFPKEEAHEEDWLEEAVVGKGFCPSHATFTGNVYKGEPFVFSLLETALDPNGDPSSVIYGCVCGDLAEGSAHEVGSPKSGKGHGGPSGGSPTSSSTSTSSVFSAGRALFQHAQRAMPYPGKKAAAKSKEAGSSWSASAPFHSGGAVYCLLSRMPLFAFFFEVLEVVRTCPEAAPAFLERLNNRGFSEELVSHGISLGDLPHMTEDSVLRLQPPRPLLCDWWSLCIGSGISPWSPVSRTVARWQVAWALGNLMARWDNLVGDTFSRLLACTLLEQKVLLLGEVPVASAAALVLRGLLWPFRWLHLFLSAPPAEELLKVPLLEGTFPLIICVSELPSQWGFRTPYELPSDVVAGILRHDYVHVSSHLETVGGLKSTALKLPEGRHAALLKQLTQVKQRLRKGEIDLQGASELIQEAAEGEVWRLARMVKEYAASQVAAARQLHENSPQERDVAQKKLQDRCLDLAMQPTNFIGWMRQARVVSCTDEALPFYRTFFSTQLCLDLLYEEIIAQVRVT